jgi:hypothetical protein
MLTASSLLDQLKNNDGGQRGQHRPDHSEYPRYNREHKRTDGFVEGQPFIAYSRKHPERPKTRPKVRQIIPYRATSSLLTAARAYWHAGVIKSRALEAISRAYGRGSHSVRLPSLARTRASAVSRDCSCVVEQNGKARQMRSSVERCP